MTDPRCYPSALQDSMSAFTGIARGSSVPGIGPLCVANITANAQALLTLCTD